MWQHHTETNDRWKYSITSDTFIIQITGGSIAIFDRHTKALLRRHKGHNYLYTGDISPDETQCFALENGKHFYVYSLENYELIKRVTLPRGYESIDMYGYYTEDGEQICIPAHKWIKNEAIAINKGRYEYVICRYDTKALTLIEKVIIEDPKPYRWKFDYSLPTFDDHDTGGLLKAADSLADKLKDTEFADRLFGAKQEDHDAAITEVTKLLDIDTVVEEIMKMIIDNQETKQSGSANHSE